MSTIEVHTWIEFNFGDYNMSLEPDEAREIIVALTRELYPPDGLANCDNCSDRWTGTCPQCYRRATDKGLSDCWTRMSE